MAYFVRKSSQSFVSAASITPVLPSHSTDDFLLLCISQDGGGTTISTATSGWSIIGSQAQSSGCRVVFAYKVAASGAETNPTFSGATDEWIVTLMVIRDADTSTPIHGNVRTDYSSVASSNSGSLTTTNNDCLLVYAWASNGISAFIRAKTDSLITRDLFATSNITHIVGTRQQYTAGAAPTVTGYMRTATEGGSGWVIAINNKSGGTRCADCRTGVSELQWYGQFGTTNTADMNPTWLAPSGFAATINGITVNTVAGSIFNTESVGLNWGQYTQISSSENLASVKLCGAYHAISSTNMSGKIFGLQWLQTSLPDEPQLGDDGNLIGFGDGSGNYVIYQLRSKTYLVPSIPIYSTIQLGVSTAYASSGTMDWTAVTKIAYLFHRKTGLTDGQFFKVKNAFLYGTPSVIGGGSNKGANFTDAVLALNSSGFVDSARIQGSAQNLLKSFVRIGDGSNLTYFKAAGSAFDYPLAYDGESNLDWRVAASGAGIDIYASASCTMDFSASIIATSQAQPFTINESSSTSATYNFTGCSIGGYDVTWKTGVPCDGATFSGCGEINAKGATFSNVSIVSTTSTDAAIAFDTSSGTLDNCTIDVTGTSALYHLELETACDSITLTDVTFTGTPGTDKVHVKKTSGTVTINISGTTTLAGSDVTTDGATVSIVADPVYQVVVVSGFTAGSRIQIYDTTNSVELFNGTASAGNTVVSGSTATWTDPATASGNRAIRIRVAYVTGATAKGFIETSGLTCGTTSTTNSITYPVTQVADTTYDNNAITGSGVTGVTFVDSSPDVVNIDVASNSITWPTIYAAWVYYAFGATGIATDIDYIDGIDTANYLLSNMKIKNTSSPSDPLVVSGGYGRDATTGASVDLVDTTGGTLIFAPDHVVSYAVGSGVTSQDKTDIATAVLSAASAAPIASNIKQVNSLTVDGTGTDADPWGPV